MCLVEFKNVYKNFDEKEILKDISFKIEKGKIAYAEAEVIDIENKNTVLTVILHQGLNRQIRKMADAIGHPVISLKRTHHGSIDLVGVKKGAFKYLKPSQIKELKNYIKKFEKASQKQIEKK